MERNGRPKEVCLSPTCAQGGPFSPEEWEELGRSLGFSRQQVQILRHLVQGLSDKEIAAVLRCQSHSAGGHIKATTVREHINRMFDKLELKNRKRTLLATTVFAHFRQDCLAQGCPRARAWA